MGVGRRRNGREAIVTQHRNGRAARYMEWGCGHCGLACLLVSNQLESLPHAHSCSAPRPFHVAPQSFAEWACGAIVIAPSQSKLARCSFYLLNSFFYAFSQEMYLKKLFSSGGSKLSNSLAMLLSLSSSLLCERYHKCLPDTQLIYTSAFFGFLCQH